MTTYNREATREQDSSTFGFLTSLFVARPLFALASPARVVIIGYLLLLVFVLNWVVDAFIIPNRIRAHRETLRQKFSQEIANQPEPANVATSAVAPSSVISKQPA
jgi:hypothetical protein